MRKKGKEGQTQLALSLELKYKKTTFLDKNNRFLGMLLYMIRVNIKNTYRK